MAVVDQLRELSKRRRREAEAIRGAASAAHRVTKILKRVRKCLAQIVMCGEAAPGKGGRCE